MNPPSAALLLHYCCILQQSVLQINPGSTAWHRFRALVRQRLRVDDRAGFARGEGALTSAARTVRGSAPVPSVASCRDDLEAQAAPVGAHAVVVAEEAQIGQRLAQQESAGEVKRIESP